MNKSEDFWRGYLTASIISLLMLFISGTAAHCEDKIVDIIRNEAIRQHFDPTVAISIAQIESNLNPNAIGPKKEIGLFQILPKYSPVAKISLFDPKINARIGILKLKEALSKCALQKDLTYVICYNNGWRKPKYPYKHPYYRKFMIAWRELND